MPSMVDILKTDEMTVTSYGNGWAYNIKFGSAENPPMRNLWFQDEDATALRDEVDAIEAHWPEMLTADVWLRALDPYL